MIRLGLCCIFHEVPIKFRSTTATYLARHPDPGSYVAEIALHNTDALDQAIRYCADHHIFSFRISSQFLPVKTHPEMGYPLPAVATAPLLACGRLAKERGVRLTFHPDQFVVLSSPRDDVVEKSIQDLIYHAELAELVGADVINIHGGGGYGDKAAALARFAKNFHRLPEKVQSRLTLENDDRVYAPADLLPLTRELKVPFCYDVHHHRFLQDHLSVAEVSQAALATWNREPLFHISSPLNATSRHHDFVSLADLPTCWRELPDFTLDAEAKAKEVAVDQLRRAMVAEGWRVR